MEKSLDRKTLSFSKGMTNIPSDLLSDDSELLESVGFIYKDGEMKPIQEPKYIGNIPYKIMYVHKQADYENIIAIENFSEEDGGNSNFCNIYFYKKEQDGFTEIGGYTIPRISSISHVGNTLVCATSEKLYYFLYKRGKYKVLNKSDLDDIAVHFTFEQFDVLDDKDRTKLQLKEIVWHGEGTAWYDSEHNFISTGDKPNNGVYSGTIHYYKPYSQDHDKVVAFNDAVVGHVNEAINWVKSKNVFAFPFFVRYALRLYDGTLARISKPILLYPSINKNGRFRKGTYYTANDGYSKYRPEAVDDSCEFFYFIDYSELLVKVTGAFAASDWNDIVREIIIYASDQVIPFNSNGEWSFKDADSTNGVVFSNGMYVSNSTSCKYNEKKYNFCYNTGDGGHEVSEAYTPLMPTYKSDEEIKNELVEKSIFYKLLSIDFDSAYQYENEYHHTIDRPDIIKSYYQNRNVLRIPSNTLSTLTEQQQMKDDYFGWCDFVAKSIFSYNSRANLIGAKRITHSPSAYSNEYHGGTDVDIYVYIQSSLQSGWVKAGSGAFPNTLLDGWFFFFHPDAKRVVFYNSTEGYISRAMKVHPRLNGAYVFTNLPSSSEPLFTSGTLESIGVNADDFVESLDSQIFTSVVNNPFVFEASGDNTVGTGKILGIVANTEAVSQGQFGQYPLMVFTDEGIYGMSVNSEGLYSATYPISREVCLNNSPLVPTDKLIFFASKKGLMAASGGQIACMSELMRGRVPRNFASLGEGKFLDFLENCQIAYDYKDSLLRIFSEGKSYQYIYNMIDKTFSMVDSGVTARSIVNDYPDNLIQGTDGSIYSLTSKPEINNDTNVYNGTITTRPLKLGGSMTLKSLRAIKNLLDTDEGKISLEIYGSNDCKHWQKLVSMGGKPYKYFTFKYKLNNFKAVDSFVGSIVEIQSRREDKIR